MRFSFESFEDKKKRLGTWHKFFAWYPVTVEDGDVRWLETVWRMKTYFAGYAGDGWTILYIPLDSDLVQGPHNEDN
jgi:hypothetical protein